MIEWLVPISMFWLMAAVFFGGLYDVENGSGGRQALGLLLTFAAYLAIFAGLRLALGGLMGPLGRLILPTAIPTMLLGRLGKIVFKLVGLRLTRVVFGASH